MVKSTLKALSLAFSLALVAPALASSSAAAPVNAKTQAPLPQSAEPAASHAAEPAGSKTGQVSINSATAQELAAALNGVGLKKAESIVSYREKYGPFSEVDQLTEVPGIGKKLVERNLASLKL